MVANSLGRLTGQINGNNAALGFYNTQASDIANTLAQQHQNQIDNLYKLYNSKLQADNLAASRAAAAPVPFPSLPNAGGTQAAGSNRSSNATNIITRMQDLNRTGQLNSVAYNMGINSLRALGYDPSKINFGFNTPSFGAQPTGLIAAQYSVPGTRPLNQGLAGTQGLNVLGGPGLSF